jgi:hypothetical protein
MTAAKDRTLIRFSAISSTLVVTWSLMNNFDGIFTADLNPMDARSLSNILSVMGLWITIVAPVSLMSSYANAHTFPRSVSSILVGCFVFAFVMSMLLFAFELRPPVEAMSVINVIVGMVLLNKAIASNDRTRVALSGSCLAIGVIGICGWWIVTFGATKVFEAAVYFSELRAEADDAVLMKDFREHAPIYLQASMYLACIPLMVAIELGSLKVALLCGRRPH